MAGKGPAVLTESDGPGEGAEGRGTEGLANGAVGGDNRPVITGNLDEEYVILDDDEGGGQGNEERLTQEEGGERPLLERQQGGQVRVYSRAEVDAMSPDERRKAWKEMTRDEQRANRQLDRVRKKDNRARGQQENAELRSELAQTREQLADLAGKVNGFAPKLGEFEKGQLQQRLTSIDSELAETNRKFDDAKRRIGEAVMSQDTEAFSKAMDDRDTAFVQRLRLQGAKEVVQQRITQAGAGGGEGGERRGEGDDRRAGGDGERRETRGRQAEQSKPLSAEAQERVADFGEQNPWFKPQDRGDRDSQLVLWIDAQVAAQGLDPATDDYWDEVDDMMRQYLPNRTGRDGGQQQQRQQPQRQNGARAGNSNANGASARRGPATGGGGDRAAPGGKGGRVEVRLTANRKEALILAGVLERDGKTVADRTKFNRMIKQYADYDREHGEVRT